MEITQADSDETNSNNKFAMEIKEEVFSESEDSNKAGDFDKGEDFDETTSNEIVTEEIKEEVFSESEDSNKEEDSNEAGDFDKGKDFDETTSNEIVTEEIKEEVFSESEDSNKEEDFDETTSNEIVTEEIKEEDFDETIVALDTYNSDLNLVIDAARFSAKPLTNGGFGFMWAGARATHGASKGKFCFEVKILRHLNVHLPKERNPHLVRVGFSVESSTMQLGEDPLSYGYDGTGNVSTNCQFKGFGKPFKAGDIIMAAVDADSEEVQIGFAKNGKFLGWAFQVGEEELKGRSLFPHILTKNVSFEVNMGQKEHPYFPLPDPLKDFTFIGCLPMPQREGGTRAPKRRGDCEVIMVCGLPGSGKSSWAAHYSALNPDKKFNILGTNNILDKMKVMGLPKPKKSHEKWDYLLSKVEKCLREMLEIGSKLKRNYILDENNISSIAQHRGMRPFTGFRRKAALVLPSEEEYKARMLKKHCDSLKLMREEGRRLPGKKILWFNLLEMKGNFRLPKVNQIFDEVIYTELQQKDAENLLIQYNDHYKKKLGKRCKQRKKKALYRTLKKCLKENMQKGMFSQRPAVNDIFNEVMEHKNGDSGKYKCKAGFEHPKDRELRNVLENCLKENVKLSEINKLINRVVNKKQRKDTKKLSIQYNDKGNAAVEPPEKTVKLSDGSQFDSGPAFPPRGNFNGRNCGGGYRVGFEGDRGGFDGSRGGFEGTQGGLDWNRGGFKGVQELFDRNRARYDWNRAGFNRNRGGFEGGLGRFNWNRGRFDRSRGGFEAGQERFNRNRRVCDWDRGGFNRIRGGFEGGQGGFNRKRGSEEMQQSADSYGNNRYFNASNQRDGYFERNTSRWSVAESWPGTSCLGSSQTSYSRDAPQIKTEPADDANTYASSSYTPQVKVEPADNSAQQ